MLATVMICDDEELIRRSLAEHLRGEGYTVVEAEDGQACLDAVAEEAPDLVITDLTMPRVDGLEVVRRLRDRNPELPVILMTAGASQSALEATRLGARAFLAKPFGLRELALTVKEVFDARLELRKRREDVPKLVEHFLTRFNAELGRAIEGVSADAMARLQAYPWPGSVRELRNVVERIAILERSRVVSVESLPVEIRLGTSVASASTAQFILPEGGVNLDALEESLLTQAIERTGGNQSAAARLLGISRYALRYRLEKLESSRQRAPAVLSANPVPNATIIPSPGSAG